VIDQIVIVTGIGVDYFCILILAIGIRSDLKECVLFSIVLLCFFSNNNKNILQEIHVLKKPYTCNVFIHQDELYNNNINGRGCLAETHIYQYSIEDVR